jgi:hypothetical protein
MQFGESPSGTGDDGLHAPFYNRPATPLKSKVWLYCIKSCHAAHRRGSPMGRVAQIVWEPAERGWLNRSTFDNPKTRGISCILLAILAAAGGHPRSVPCGQYDRRSGSPFLSGPFPNLLSPIFGKDSVIIGLDLNLA